MSAAPRAAFELTDHAGRRINQNTFLGRYLLVYFGFTHCRVVCPRSLAKLSSVLERLGEVSSQITPLYITVDPDRDTPEVLADYLESRYPRFTGLTGSVDEIEGAKAAFRVFAERRRDPEDEDGYAVPHTAIAYLMDRRGDYCAHFTDALDEEAIVARISARLHSVE